jgi:hypothetical protein
MPGYLEVKCRPSRWIDAVSYQRSRSTIFGKGAEVATSSITDMQMAHSDKESI